MIWLKVKLKLKRSHSWYEVTCDEDFKDINIKISNIYIFSFYQDHLFMLIFDRYGKQSLCYRIHPGVLEYYKLRKQISRGKTIKLIKSDKFFVEDLNWNCKNEEEFTNYAIHRVVSMNKGDLIQVIQL